MPCSVPATPIRPSAWSDNSGASSASSAAAGRTWDRAARKPTYANRRRILGARGKRLLRARGEKLERAFAHLLTTGGMRRTHLRGHENIRKRLLVHAAGFNLGLLMRSRFGYGTPRSLQGRSASTLRKREPSRAFSRSSSGQIRTFRVTWGPPGPGYRSYASPTALAQQSAATLPRSYSMVRSALLPRTARRRPSDAPRRAG
ncbi:transposase [Candidatus Palauibacter sp.]|uniref:transposase n=1 Tax=Candidatus Palauibacter sp. TaxID=3101350 RepID=UPI003B02BDD6